MSCKFLLRYCKCPISFYSYIANFVKVFTRILEMSYKILLRYFKFLLGYCKCPISFFMVSCLAVMKHFVTSQNRTVLQLGIWNNAKGC